MKRPIVIVRAGCAGAAKAVDAWRGVGRGVARALAVGVLATSAACTTSGHAFDATGLDFLVPGQTTLAQASALLKSDPVNVYRQADGAATARWAHHSSFVPDAVYFNREIWLAFDANGYFERMVKSTNVPQAHALPSY